MREIGSPPSDRVSRSPLKSRSRSLKCSRSRSERRIPGRSARRSRSPSIKRSQNRSDKRILDVSKRRSISMTDKYSRSRSAKRSRSRSKNRSRTRSENRSRSRSPRLGYRRSSFPTRKQSRRSRSRDYGRRSRSRDRHEGREPAKIFIGNLEHHTDEVDLEEHFKRYGPLEDVYVPRDQRNRSNRGYAFITFQDRRDAEDACTEDGVDLNGRRIGVNIAKRRPGGTGKVRTYVPSRDGDGGSMRAWLGTRRRSRSRDRRRSRSHSRGRRSRSWR